MGCDRCLRIFSHNNYGECLADCLILSFTCTCLTLWFVNTFRAIGEPKYTGFIQEHLVKNRYKKISYEKIDTSRSRKLSRLKSIAITQRNKVLKEVDRRSLCITPMYLGYAYSLLLIKLYFTYTKEIKC